MDFCFVAPYSVMVRNNRLEGRCCLHLQGWCSWSWRYIYCIFAYQTT
jgi:hypothetical protein